MRKFQNHSIEQLERIFDENRDNRQVVESVLAETAIRTTKRAKKLHERCVARMGLGFREQELSNLNRKHRDLIEQITKLGEDE